MSAPKIVVHTDVFLEHLCRGKQPSVLRQAMGRFFCYTTVYQAIELFSLAKTEREVKTIEDTMAAMKVMGLNPKNARKFGELIAFNRNTDMLDILIAGLCMETRLPILTNRKKDFAGIKGLTIIPTKLIESGKSGEEILRTVKR